MTTTDPTTRPTPEPTGPTGPEAVPPTDPPTAGAAPVPRTPRPGDTEVLASDPEREHVADRLRAAATEGRLTLSEADERQAAAYAARTRAELVPLVSDLPPTHHPRPRRGELTPRARRNLRVHTAAVGALFSLLVLVWLVGGGPFFPAFPVFLMVLSLFVHLRRAERGPSPDHAVPDELR